MLVLGAGMGLVFSLLAEIQDEHDLATTTLGLIAAAGLLVGVAAQTALSPLADRGHARQLLVGSVVVGSVGVIGFAMSTEAWQFVAFRAISGLSFGAFVPAAQAVVSRAAPERAGAALGNLAGVQMGGFLIGPGVGAVIAVAWNIDTPFWILGVLMMLLAPFLARVPIPEITAPDRPRVRRLDLLRRRDALASIVLAGALLLPAGMYEAIWARYLDDLGASTLFIGLSLTFYGIPFIVMAPIGGRLSDRIGPMRTIPIAVAIVIPLPVLYGHLPWPWILAGLAAVEAIGNGFGIPPTQAVMASATADHERATGMGLNAAAGQVTAGLAALVSAPLYEHFGPGWTFGVVAALVAVLAAVGLAIGRTSASDVVRTGG